MSSANGSCERRLYWPRAVDGLEIKFQLRAEIVLGITPNAWLASSESPKVFCPAPGVPGNNQWGLGTSAGNTTLTPAMFVIAKDVRTLGAVSSPEKPTWAATSRIAVAGSSWTRVLASAADLQAVPYLRPRRPMSPFGRLTYRPIPIR